MPPTIKGVVILVTNMGAVREAFVSNDVCKPLVLAVESAASAIDVALPVEVTMPVRFAFVVTVAALPDIFVWSPVLVPLKLVAEIAPVKT